MIVKSTESASSPRPSHALDLAPDLAEYFQDTDTLLLTFSETTEKLDRGRAGNDFVFTGWALAPSAYGPDPTVRGENHESKAPGDDLHDGRRPNPRVQTDRPLSRRVATRFRGLQTSRDESHAGETKHRPKTCRIALQPARHPLRGTGLPLTRQPFGLSRP